MCTHPIKAFVVPGAKSKNGKRVFRFTSIDAPFHPDMPDSKDYEILSCGKCKECRLKAAREWSVRCCAEASLYPENYNWFLTLTYDDDHLPLCRWRDILTGEYIATLPNLSKPHIQDFLDDLRSYFRYHYDHSGCRAFYCGEFGSSTARSHYHMCLFNTPISLLTDWSVARPYSRSDLGHPLYHSETLDRIWGKGLVLFSPNTPETVAYTARYTLKKAGLPGDSLMCTLRARAKTSKHYMDLLHLVNEMNFHNRHYQFELKKLKKFVRQYPALSSKYHKQIEKERRRLLTNIKLTEVKAPEGQQSEFIGMSTHPGLGAEYFRQHPDEIYLMNEIWSTGKPCAVPKYFKALYEVLSSDLYDYYKRERHSDSLLSREMSAEDNKITSWQHDVIDLRRNLVDSYSKVYKRGDF